MKTYYDVLGVSRETDAAVIAAAYRALAKKYHPDTQPEGADPEPFRRITEAYTILADPERRRRYDETLVSAASEPLIEQTSRSAKETRTRDAQPQEVAARRERPASPPTPPKRGTLIGNTFWLLLGVPIAYLLGMLFAHVLVVWVITVALDWLTSDHYTIWAPINSLFEVLMNLSNAFKSDEPVATPDNFFSVALTAGWMFFCSSASAGAIVSMARDDRPNLPLWLTYLALLVVWSALSFNGFSKLDATSSMMEWLSFGSVSLALLGGIALSNSSSDRRRSAAVPTDAAPAMT